MASVSIYLNFQGKTEEAFRFYKNVFKTDFIGPILYNRDIPEHEGVPAFNDEDKNKIMHICLPILAGVNLMGTDMLESMGHKLVLGNNITINLEPDSKIEADRLYKSLSEDATEFSPMRQEQWGYWGTCLDRFGTRWMFNYFEESAK